MLRAPALALSLVAVAVAAIGCGSHRRAGSCDGPCPASKIDHLVVIVQENHSFDSYFGRYCTAPTGSAPSCTSGPGCCEAGPPMDPSGAVPVILDDHENGAYGPANGQDCELAEIDGGKMDRFASGGPMGCSDPRNVAYAGAPLIMPYWQLAATGALADRYFQPVAGATSANELYFARAQFVFKDNDYAPDAIGHACAVAPRTKELPGPTLGDLLDAAHVSWAYYVAGYQAMVDAQSTAAVPPRPTAAASAPASTRASSTSAICPSTTSPRPRTTRACCATTTRSLATSPRIRCRRWCSCAAPAGAASTPACSTPSATAPASSARSSARCKRATTRPTRSSS
jgi:phospholipase C